MAELATNSDTIEKKRFQHVTELIRQNFDPPPSKNPLKVNSDAADLFDHLGYKHMVQAVQAFQKNQFENAVSCFQHAAEILGPEEHPLYNSIYSTLYINAQIALDRRQRPVTQKAYTFFKNNIAALRKIDPELAQKISQADWHQDWVVIQGWDGLHFLSASRKCVMVLADLTKKGLDQKIKSRDPITFGNIGTGRELIYCLENQVDIIYGMTRVHYVMEPDITKLKALLHLYDFTKYLMARELVLFGGDDMDEQIIKWFDSMRYPLPAFMVGDVEQVQAAVKTINEHLVERTPIDQVKQYYQSEEFRSRQRQIADGHIMPRVLTITCKWTTFLKYCAKDFDVAFQKIDCPTRFIIEENDVQSLLPCLFWNELHQFQPDAVFMVSHARPSSSYLPSELPFICYMQDKCGPLLSLPSLKDHISPQDLFVCMVDEFPHYLNSKGVPLEQAVVMPIPADETMFFPMEPDHEQVRRFRNDVSFVKHGGPAVDVAFREFWENASAQITDPKLKENIQHLLTAVYNKFCLNASVCPYESQIQDYFQSALTEDASENIRHLLRQLATQFYIVVASAAWRYQFIEALDRSRMDVALFGNGWERNEKLSHLNRGPVERNVDLNAVYNASKITLNIHHGCTMHQRVSECGLAGGFIMIANHPEEHDWLPAANYFEPDKEIVLFEDPNDLVDKCRYYLDHTEQRVQIAQNLHQRCLKEHTCTIGAKKMIDQWRRVLKKTLE